MKLLRLSLSSRMEGQHYTLCFVMFACQVDATRHTNEGNFGPVQVAKNIKNRRFWSTFQKTCCFFFKTLLTAFWSPLSIRSSVFKIFVSKMDSVRRLLKRKTELARGSGEHDVSQTPQNTWGRRRVRRPLGGWGECFASP